MKLSGVQVKAVVDFFEIEARTAQPSQGQHVHRKLKQCGIESTVFPIDDSGNVATGKARTSNRFKIRIQDPANGASVQSTLTELTHCLTFIPESVKLTAIEVALDLYGGTPESVAQLYRGLTNVPSANHRIYRDKEAKRDKPSAIPQNSGTFVRLIEDGWQIAIGNQTDEHYVHAYWKTHDNGQPLDTSEHRARIEVRLQGQSLPCDASTIMGMDFTVLSDCFKFRKDRDDLNPLEQVISSAKTQIGERKKRNRSEGGTRMHSAITQADTALNRKAYDALRGLSKTWQSDAKPRARRRPTPSSKGTACGFCGDNEGGNNLKPASMLDSSDSSINYIHEHNKTTAQTKGKTAGKANTPTRPTDAARFASLAVKGSPSNQTSTTGQALQSASQTSEPPPKTKGKHPLFE